MKKTMSKRKAAASSAAPVAEAKTQRATPPKGGFIDSGRGRRIIHRELIASITSSAAFTATKIPLNPGLAASFPWLSTQASGWEQYKFNKLTFEYVTRTSTATVGSIILTPDYDASDAAPTSEAVATNAMDAVEDAVWKNFSCRLTPSAMFPIGPRKFVRTAAQAGDLRAYDAGNLFVCTVESAAAVGIGKLWVDYDVELYVPASDGAHLSATYTSLFYGSTVPQAAVTTVPLVLSWAPVTDAHQLQPYGAAGDITTMKPSKGSYNVDFGVHVHDTVVEATTITLEVLEDGVAAFTRTQTIPAGPLDHFVHAIGFLETDGQTVVTLRATVTGAAGVLTIIRDGSYFRIVPA